VSIFDKKINVQDRFDKASKGKSNGETRVIEEALLKPNPIPDYTGDTPKHHSNLEYRLVNIAFKTDNDMKLVNDYVMTISESFKGEKYITDISLLIHIAKAIKKGWDVAEVLNTFFAEKKAEKEAING